MTPALARLVEALQLARSMINSREPMSFTAQKVFDDALAAVAQAGEEPDMVKRKDAFLTEAAAEREYYRLKLADAREALRLADEMMSDQHRATYAFWRDNPAVKAALGEKA